MKKMIPLFMVFFVLIIIMPIAAGYWREYKREIVEMEAIEAIMKNELGYSEYTLKFNIKKKQLDRKNNICHYQAEMAVYSPEILEKLKLQEYEKGQGKARTDIISNYSERSSEAVVDIVSGTFISKRIIEDVLIFEFTVPIKNKNGEKEIVTYDCEISRGEFHMSLHLAE